jgi:uncharacterized protein involved in exopolysaccharide biosynthesis
MNSTASDSRSHNLTIVDVAVGLWTYRWSSLAIVSCLTVLAAVVAFVSTPIYRAEVLLSPQADDSAALGGLGGIVRQLGDLGPLAGLAGLGDAGLKEEAMALLTSRSFLTAFIKDEDLMQVLYPGVPEFHSAAGLAPSSDSDELPTIGDAYYRFKGRILQVEEDSESGLVTLAIEWRDPVVAAKWANLLAQRINAHMRARAITESSRSIDYLHRELTKTSVVGIQEGIYRLIESRISQIALANARDGYAFRVIDGAVAPEEKDFVRPQRRLLIALGIVGGSLIAFVVALLRLVWQRHR